MLNLSDNELKEDIEVERLYSIRLVNSSKSLRLIGIWLGMIFLVGIISLFLPWQQNLEGSGIVTAFSPNQRPQAIQTLIAGRIEMWYVQEGQYVNKGDTIVRISETKEKFMDPLLVPRLKNQIDSKKSSIESKRAKVVALQNQINAIRSSLKLSIAKAQNKVQQTKMYITIDSVEYIAAYADNEIARKQMERQQKLFDQGLVSLTNLEQRNLKFQQTNAKYISALNKYNSTKNDYLNSLIEINSLEAEYNEKISKAESDMNNTLSEIFDSEAGLSKQQIDVANMEIRNGYYIIRAPQDGFIVKATKQGLGETVKDGEEICTIMPNNPKMAVELYIKPMDLPLVYIGCPVRLQFDGWPAIVFAGWPGASVGTYGGKVQVIDYINSNNGKYRLLISPDENDKPWPTGIRMGSGVMGWAMLNNVLLGYEIWRQFNGFPPEFTKKFSKNYKKKKSSVGETKDESDE